MHAWAIARLNNLARQCVPCNPCLALAAELASAQGFKHAMDWSVIGAALTMNLAKLACTTRCLIWNARQAPR